MDSNFCFQWCDETGKFHCVENSNYFDRRYELGLD
jgi:hypothetical protein